MYRALQGKASPTHRNTHIRRRIHNGIHRLLLAGALMFTDNF